MEQDHENVPVRI